MTIANEGNITITATVNPTSVAKVAFYVNSLLIGESTSEPYSITRNFLKADYTLVVRQFNKDGTHTTSAPVNIFADNALNTVVGDHQNKLILHPNPSKTEIYLSGIDPDNKITKLPQ